jgi:transcriptional regulator with XRE-family HTH domain
LFSIYIPLEKQQVPGYPEFPITVGDHIRKKRMGLGLLQREVAEIIGVTESSIWNREHGTETEMQYNHSIIKFPGYFPFDCPDDTVWRLAWYKRAMGMNLDHLGEAMGRDPEQLSDWLSGRHNPFRKNREKIERFLEGRGLLYTSVRA